MKVEAQNGVRERDKMKRQNHTLSFSTTEMRRGDVLSPKAGSFISKIAPLNREKRENILRNRKREEKFDREKNEFFLNFTLLLIFIEIPNYYKFIYFKLHHVNKLYEKTQEYRMGGEK